MAVYNTPQNLYLNKLVDREGSELYESDVNRGIEFLRQNLSHCTFKLMRDLFIKYAYQPCLKEGYALSSKYYTFSFIYLLLRQIHFRNNSEIVKEILLVIDGRKETNSYTLNNFLSHLRAVFITIMGMDEEKILQYHADTISYYMKTGDVLAKLTVYIFSLLYRIKKDKLLELNWEGM